MDRIEIEIKLNRVRAWLLVAYAKFTEHELTRGATTSEADPAVMWSARDHLSHLAGIERSFNAMIRRHLAGDANPVGLARNADGTPRPLPEIMAGVHRSNEAWVASQRARPLSEVIADGQAARAETLALLASLSDAQLADKLPGAPWADGTVGGVIAVNALHGRMHWQWLKEAKAPAGG